MGTIRYFRYWTDSNGHQKRKGGKYHKISFGGPLCEGYTTRPTASADFWVATGWDEVPEAERCRDCVRAQERLAILAHC
jgi:hypothetical protein